MMKAAGKFLLYSLIALFVFSSLGGYLLMYVFQQANFAYIHMVKPSNDQLEVFKISIKDYSNSETYHEEFTHNGKLYDVIKTETKNGYIFLHCHHDQLEECIINAIGDLFQSGAHQPLSKQTVKLFFAFNTIPLASFTFYNYQDGVDLHIREYGQLPFCFIDIISPPPKS